MDRTACIEPQCLYSIAIPLLPLWTVRTVRSLSTCTRLHFTFTRDVTKNPHDSSFPDRPSNGDKQNASLELYLYSNVPGWDHTAVFVSATLHQIEDVLL